MQTTQTQSTFKVKNKLLEFKTKKQLEFIDITDILHDFIKESGASNGLLNVQSFHTTAAILVNENEPLLIEDIKKHFYNMVPTDIYYGHDDFDIRTVNMCDGECQNGFSHCLATHLPTSVTLNVVGGKIQFGEWQRVFLVELDRSRPRKVQLQVLGT